jgi:hypothetical protein
MDQPWSKYDWRQISPSQILGTANQCTYKSIEAYDATRYELACDTLPFMNRGAAENRESRDVTAANLLQHHVHFDSLYAKLTLVNNFDIPSIFDVYLLRVKLQTSSNPETILTAGDSDKGVADADTNLLTYPSDFKHFNRVFAIEKHQRVILRAGDQFDMVATRKNHKYDPTAHDRTGNTYDKGDMWFFIRHHGAVSHDQTTTSNVGTGDGGADIIIKRKFMIKYQGDVAYETIETNNTLGAQSTPETSGPNVENITDNP